MFPLFFLVADASVVHQPIDKDKTFEVVFYENDLISGRPRADPMYVLPITSGTKRFALKFEDEEIATMVFQATDHCRLRVAMDAGSFVERTPKMWPWLARHGDQFTTWFQIGWHVWKIRGEVRGVGKCNSAEIIPAMDLKPAGG
jgi:hypothetical protein